MAWFQNTIVYENNKLGLVMGKGCYLKHLLAKRFLSFMHLEPQLRGVTSREKREYNSPEGVECGIILIFPFLSLIILLIKITVFH